MYMSPNMLCEYFLHKFTKFPFMMILLSMFWIITLLIFFIFSAVAKDKDKQSFKLRAGMDKKIVIYVQQTSNKELAIER